MSARDVLITGIGLVSSLGEGAERHWQLFSSGAEPVVDSERFPPYSIHPLPEIDWSQQIVKRGDQRQMETWQRLGTYAAGLALDDAGAKEDEALCGEMDMIVAAGGGERDVAVDSSIMTASETENDIGSAINRILTTDLRPTLFLAQLSNLLAGNISIVHKVTGSSRTFMGEEGAGISAIETAAARIRAGQSSIALVGGAYQTEHPDMLLSYDIGGYLHRGDWKPVWSRGESEGGGVVTGSGAAFLVLESREHAEKRGRTAYAQLGEVRSAAMRRGDGHAEAFGKLIDAIWPTSGERLVISGASGADAATAAEADAFAARDLVSRGLSSLTGHLKEAQFPFAVALAALAVRNGAAPAPFAADEKSFAGAPDTVLATTVGYWGSEGLAIVTQAE